MSIAYSKGFKYQLRETAVFENTMLRAHNGRCEWIELFDGKLTIKAGYAWDGCSGPTFDTPNTMRPSLAHDALYQLIRQDKLPRSFKDRADDIFYYLMIQDGVLPVRAAAFHWAVKKYGHSATLPSHRKAILYAP